MKRSEELEKYLKELENEKYCFYCRKLTNNKRKWKLAIYYKEGFSLETMYCRPIVGEHPMCEKHEKVYEYEKWKKGKGKIFYNEEKED